MCIVDLNASRPPVSLCMERVGAVGVAHSKLATLASEVAASSMNRRLRDHTLPMSTAWLLNDIAEARGRQELYTRQSPQVLQALLEMALIQSAESSNRIEGVTAAARARSGGGWQLGNDPMKWVMKSAI